MEILFSTNCTGELSKTVYSTVKVNWITNKTAILKWIAGPLRGKMMGLTYFVFRLSLSLKFISKDFWSLNQSALFDMLFPGYSWDDDFSTADL